MNDIITDNFTAESVSDDLNERSEQHINLTLNQTFEQECEMALIFGLTYEQYWDGKFDIYLYYAKRYYALSKNTIAEQDMNAWMTGAYVRDALSEVLSAIVGAKGKKPKYPKSPHFYTEFDRQAKEEQEKRKQEQELKNLELLFLQAAKKHAPKVQ